MKGAQDERYADALLDQAKDDRAERNRMRLQLEILGERVLEILNRKWADGEQGAAARDYMAIRQAARSMRLLRDPLRPVGSAPAPYPATYSDDQVAELRAADLAMRSGLASMEASR